MKNQKQQNIKLNNEKEHSIGREYCHDRGVNDPLDIL